MHHSPIPRVHLSGVAGKGRAEPVTGTAWQDVPVMHLRLILMHCDVTAAATSDILSWLKAEGMYDDGAVAVTAVDASPSKNARATEEAAPDDAVAHLTGSAARPNSAATWLV